MQMEENDSNKKIFWEENIKADNKVKKLSYSPMTRNEKGKRSESPKGNGFFKKKAKGINSKSTKNGF